MKSSPKLGLADLLAELARAPDSPSEGMTVREISEAATAQGQPISRDTLRERLWPLVKSGKVVVGQGFRPDMTGRRVACPVYRVVKGKK